MKLNDPAKICLVAVALFLVFGSPAFAGIALIAALISAGFLVNGDDDEDDFGAKPTPEENEKERQKWINECASVFRSVGEVSSHTSRSLAVSHAAMQAEENGPYVEDWENPVIVAHDEMRYWSNDE